MATRNGSLKGLGNVVELDTLNDGASRRYALSGASGELLVENDSAAYRIYYLAGDSSVNLTALASADGFIPKSTAIVIDVAESAAGATATHVSFWAESNTAECAICEVD